MPRKFSKRLVIDASVAFSAGKKGSGSRRSRRCRAFLEEVIRICHRVVMTGELSAEWRAHASPFAVDWLVQMKSRGKRIRVGEDVRDYELHASVQASRVADKNRKAMAKDLHLIEAALASDRLIVSCDDRARALFRGAAAHVPELRLVVWVNPEQTEEDAIRWLREGARSGRMRLLSARERSAP